MPPAGSCSCGDLHSSSQQWEILLAWGGSGMGGCSPPSGFEPLLGWRPDFGKSFEALPLQVDLKQHSWHLLQFSHKTIERHMKHFAHILICNLFESNILLTKDLCLSFVAARVQKLHVLQQEALHLTEILLSVYKELTSFCSTLSCFRSVCLETRNLQSNCHL